MKFIITRIAGEVPESLGATMQPHECWQTRTLSELEFNKKFSDREGAWRSKGKNHTTKENGWVTRQVEDIERLTIEINSLEDLMKIVNEFGQCVVSPPDDIRAPSIEIYDDYRE